MINKYTSDKWNNVETVGDFLNFIEDPAIDYMDWANSFGDSNKSGFWIGAKVKNIPDVSNFIDKNPQIKSTELSLTTMTPSERDHHEKFNYGNGYDRHIPPKELVKIADILGFKRIIHFYNLWYYQQQKPTDFLLIKYEDLLENGVSELARVCVFLDIKCNLSIIEEVYMNSSANKMRKKEMKNQLDGFNNFGKERDQLKVRNAKIGGYLNELSQHDIEYCNNEMSDLDPYFNYCI